MTKTSLSMLRAGENIRRVDRASSTLLVRMFSVCFFVVLYIDDSQRFSD